MSYPKSAPLLALCFFGLMASITMALWLPPFAAPDEPAHWYRSVHVSYGHVLSEVRADQLGAPLPAWAPKLFEAVYLGMPAPYGKIDAARWDRARAVTADAEPRFTHFPSTAIYPPVFYLPQALAIGACRALHFSPLATFYCARLVNTATSWLFIAVALASAQELAFFWAALLLLPITAQQMGTLSPDAGMVACSIWLAVTLRRAMRAFGPQPKLWAQAIVCVALLAQTRPPLLALTALLWAPALVRHAGASPLRARLTATAVVLATSVPWFLGCLLWGGRLRPDLPAPSVRAHMLLADPMGFAHLLVHTTKVQAGAYLWMLTCGLGWFDTPIVGAGYTAAKASLLLGLLLAVGRGFRVGRADALFIWVAMVGSYVAMQIIFFLTWMPVDATIIEGFQGRYMLMYLPLLPLALPRLAWPRGIAMALQGAGICAAARMLAAVPWTLLERYYLHRL